MKTYRETVDALAKKMYHQYMGGENDLRIDGVAIIADIYKVTIDKLYQDVHKKFHKVTGD